MAANGNLNFPVNVGEVIPAGDGYAASTLNHALAQFAGLTTSRSFGGTGTPTWEIPWSDTVDLSGGTALIDLTALARPAPLEDVDMAGKKIVYAAFAGAAANSNPIEVAPDATAGYNIFGTADDKITVYPGQICEYASMVVADLATIVAATNDEILFTGIGTEQIHVLLVAGV